MQQRQIRASLKLSPSPPALQSAACTSLPARRYDAGCKGTDYAPASYMTLPPGSPPLSPEVGRGTACMAS